MASAFSGLMGEGFMGGGCTPPLKIFFNFRLRSLRYEKDFLPVLSKLSQASYGYKFTVTPGPSYVGGSPANKR